MLIATDLLKKIFQKKIENINKHSTLVFRAVYLIHHPTNKSFIVPPRKLLSNTRLKLH